MVVFQTAYAKGIKDCIRYFYYCTIKKKIETGYTVYFKKTVRQKQNSYSSPVHIAKKWELKVL